MSVQEKSQSMSSISPGVKNVTGKPRGGGRGLQAPSARNRVNPPPLGYLVERGRFCPIPTPLPNSPLGLNGAAEAALDSYNECLLREFENEIFERSEVRSMSSRRPKPSLFVLPVTETGLMAAANQNFGKMRLKV